MKRGAVVIGVNKTGDLPVLMAAASGARDFADWARGQKIEVKLLTDENNKRVTLDNIKQAINHFVKQGTFGQLIVFFSGHGILRGPQCELWLLSGAKDDVDEAVNVRGSLELARWAKIPHIVAISDACRSRPNAAWLSQVDGGIIFPNNPPQAPVPDVDVFYATLPGDPALEVPPDDAVQSYRGIFTACLLKGLGGEVPEVIEEVDGPPASRRLIPSKKLKPYLLREVPIAASDAHITLQQDPDIRPESDLPKYLAEVLAPQQPARAPSITPSSGGPTFGGPVITRSRAIAFPPKEPTKKPIDALKLMKDISMKIPISPTSQTPLQDPELGIAPSMERLLKAKGRKSFETRTGFTVVNEGVARAAITSGHCDVFQDLGAFQIRVHVDSNQNKPRSLLVQFTPGTGTVLAVLPGFIGTIVVEDRRVVSVNYTPSHYTDRYQQEYQHVEDEIEKRRALVAVLARNGSFEIERERVHELADYLRMFKSLDPTLGLYATYAYAQAGAYKNVASVHGYMLDEQKSTGIPIPFDVSLLAHKLSEDYWSSVVRVAPFCPMLSQGWALLEPFRGKLSDPVRAAGRFMVPSLWTTFQDKGVDILWSAIEKGAIKSN